MTGAQPARQPTSYGCPAGRPSGWPPSLGLASRPSASAGLGRCAGRPSWRWHSDGRQHDEHRRGMATSLTTPDDSYPSTWPGARPQPAAPAAPTEAIQLAIDAYIAALSPQEFTEMVSRTRG